MELYFDEKAQSWAKMPSYSVEIFFETAEERAKFEKEWNERSLYKWHDLQKNPDDLPPVGTMVLAETDNLEFIVAVKYSDCWTVNTPLHLLEMPDSVKVTAWRNIEPFKAE